MGHYATQTNPSSPHHHHRWSAGHPKRTPQHLTPQGSLSPLPRHPPGHHHLLPILMMAQVLERVNHAGFHTWCTTSNSTRCLPHLPTQRLTGPILLWRISRYFSVEPPEEVQTLWCSLQKFSECWTLIIKNQLCTLLYFYTTCKITSIWTILCCDNHQWGSVRMIRLPVDFYIIPFIVSRNVLISWNTGPPHSRQSMYKQQVNSGHTYNFQPQRKLYEKCIWPHGMYSWTLLVPYPSMDAKRYGLLGVMGYEESLFV